MGLRSSVILRLLCSLFFVWHISCAVGSSNEWRLVAPQELTCNKLTTVTIQQSGVPALTTNTLWLGAANSAKTLIPETVISQGISASFPIFLRSIPEKPEIYVFDTSVRAVTTITLPVSKHAPQWMPYLTISSFANQPIVFTNQEVTPTLTLTQGSGEPPATAHIVVEDHRGRKVVSRFFDTRDLIAGAAGMRFPATGRYQVVVKLLKEPITSMPLAQLRDPISVPFGRIAANMEDPFQYSENVTTDVVIGTRITLEHIPTTATVVGEDRFPIAVLAAHSTEMSRNRWPFAVASEDLRKKTSEERGDFAAKQLTLQRLLGGGFTPVAIKWSEFQTGPASFSWFLLNDLLPIYTNAKIRPLLQVSGESAWNNQLPTETTATLAAWTNGLRELSGKYQPLLWGLHCYTHPEDTWSTAPGTKDYSALLLSIWEGFLKRENTVLPGPPIVIGGTRTFKRQYLDDILTTQTVPKAGALGFDLFPDNEKESPESNGFPEILADAKKLLRNNRAGELELWILGTGWSNTPDSVDSALQANYLVRTHVHALMFGAHKVIWHSLADYTQLPWEGERPDRMGLLRRDMSIKPAGIAYNLTSYMMSGVTSGTALKQGKAEIYKFDIPLQNNKWPGLLYVAWTGSPSEKQEIHLDMTMGGGVYALDYLGAEIPASNIDENSDNPLLGTYRVPVGFEPVFIWDAGKPGRVKKESTDKNQE